jgi:hypothetical protein
LGRALEQTKTCCPIRVTHQTRRKRQQLLRKEKGEEVTYGCNFVRQSCHRNSQAPLRS